MSPGDAQVSAEEGMRLLVVDDDLLVAEVFSTYLRSMWGCEVFVVTDVVDARRMVASEGPYDLVLADFRMPGESGMPFVTDLVALNHPNPVVIVSGKIGPHAAQAVIAAGARGYISKRTGASKMLRRLEMVLSGETYIPPEILLEEVQDPAGPEDVKLTFRERQVLSGIREGLSNKEIARELNLSDITVKLHVRAILKKYGFTNRTQLAMMGQGADTRLSDGAGAIATLPGAPLRRYV